MISTQRTTIVGGAAKVKLLTSSGQSIVGIRTSGAIFIGGPSLTVANGFLISGDNPPLNLKNNDELWALSTSSAVVNLIILN